MLLVFDVAVDDGTSTSKLAWHILVAVIHGIEAKANMSVLTLLLSMLGATVLGQFGATVVCFCLWQLRCSTHAYAFG